MAALGGVRAPFTPDPGGSLTDTHSQQATETTPRGLLRLYYKVVLSAGSAVLILHALIGAIAGFGSQFAPYQLVLDGFLLLLAYIGFELSAEPLAERKRRRPSAFILPLIGLHLVVLCSETGGLASPYFVLMLVTAVFAGLVFSARSAMCLTAVLAATHLMASWLLPDDGLLIGGLPAIKSALVRGRSMSLGEITSLCMHSAFLFLGSFLAMRLSLTFKGRVEALTHDATRDPLTQLVNRRGFTDKVQDEIERAQRFRWPMSILVLDLDFFKQVNDQHGHAFGDEVLKRTAAVLRESVGPVDHLARTGGEEFAVAAVAAEPGHGAELAARITRRFRDHAWNEMRPGFKLTCSVGVAVLDASRMAGLKPDQILTTLLEQADQALYRVKAGGRDGWQVHDDQHLRTTGVTSLRDLR